MSFSATRWTVPLRRYYVERKRKKKERKKKKKDPAPFRYWPTAVFVPSPHSITVWKWSPYPYPRRGALTAAACHRRCSALPPAARFPPPPTATMTPPSPSTPAYVRPSPALMLLGRVSILFLFLSPAPLPFPLYWLRRVCPDAIWCCARARVRAWWPAFRVSRSRCPSGGWQPRKGTTRRSLSPAHSNGKHFFGGEGETRRAISEGPGLSGWQLVSFVFLGVRSCCWGVAFGVLRGVCFKFVIANWYLDWLILSWRHALLKNRPI